MKKIANDLKVGNIITMDGDFYSILSTEHVMPGKGGAFIQVTARNVKKMTKKSARFRSNESVECAFTEENTYQYLYSAGDNIVCMNMDTFEEVNIPIDLLGDKAKLLEDNMNISVLMCEGSPVMVNLPKQVTVTVTYTDPSLKNQTATASYKNAETDRGVNIQVPQFIKSGDRIVISTEELTYVERDTSK